MGNNVNSPKLHHKAQAPWRSIQAPLRPRFPALPPPPSCSLCSDISSPQCLRWSYFPTWRALPSYLCMLDSNPLQRPEPMPSSPGGPYQPRHTKSISLCSVFLWHHVYAPYTVLSLFTRESAAATASCLVGRQ